MQLYRNILLQAIKITWNNKYLWIFGLFATFISSSGGYEIMMKIVSGEGGVSIVGLQKFLDTGVLSAEGLANIKILAQTDLLGFIILLIILIAIVAIFGLLIWAAIVSQIAIVHDSAKIIKSKTSTQAAPKGLKKEILQSGYLNGIKNFWPVLGLNIILKAILVIVFTIISYYLFFTAGQPGGIVVEFFNIIIFTIFIAIILSLSFIIKYAIVFIVIQEQSFKKSLKLGWQLFAKNYLASLELAFILFALNFFVGLVVALLILVCSIPFLFLGLVFYKAASFIGFWTVLIVALISLFVLVTIIGSIITTFQITCWTRFFIELTEKGVKSKLVRTLSKKK